MKTTGPLRSVRGFSMVEVLVAAGIMLIIAVGVLPLFTSSIRSNRQGNDSTQVSNFARERVEQFFQLPFNSAPMTVDTGVEKVFDEYYSESDDEWKAGTPPGDGTDPALWTRTTTVRQYAVDALDDGLVETDEALPAGTTPSRIHLKEIEVTVASTARSGVLGPGKRITLRSFKSQ